MKSLKDKLQAKHDDSIAERIDPADKKLEALEVERDHKNKSNKVDAEVLHVMMAVGTLDRRDAHTTNINLKVSIDLVNAIKDIAKGNQTLIYNEILKYGVEHAKKLLKKGPIIIEGR